MKQNAVERAAKEVHCQKRFAVFPSPAGMSLIKLSLAGNNLMAGAGNPITFFIVYRSWQEMEVC
jgi:hypothetical protein